MSPSFDDVWVLSGWAADPDAPGPVEIQVYMGSVGYTAGFANRPRADVGAALPWAGQNTGFLLTIGAGWMKRQSGSDHLCVYAYNRNAGTSTTLGCHHVDAPGAPSSNNPIGHIDAAPQSQGLLRLLGWTGDRGGDVWTLVRIYDNGVPLTQFTADRARPDVQAATGLGPNTGFDFTIPLYPGRHQVCLYAQNSGVGTSNTTLGCITRTEPGPVAPGPHDPRGSFDSLTRGPCCTPQTGTGYPARGWAFDPDSSSPVQIVLRSWNVPNIPPNGVREVSTNTSLARPDVQAAFPGAGPNTGFVIDGNAYFPGYVPVCVWAKNIGPGTDRFLGCRWSAWF